MDAAGAQMDCCCGREAMARSAERSSFYLPCGFSRAQQHIENPRNDYLLIKY